MIEMLGVLAVIGVLSAGGLWGYSQAMKKHRMNQTQEQIQQIISNVRTKFAHTMRPETLTLEQAIELGIFPEDMIKSATELQNKYKGSVTFETTTLNGKTVYKLRLDGLPKDVASQLGMTSWKNDKSMVRVILNEDRQSAEETEEPEEGD